MKKELEMVAEFHHKVGSPVLSTPSQISAERSAFREKLMSDEVKEYKEGADIADLENIAKELADILYTTYGTILEHGLQDKMPEIFAEVHRSNMSKDYSGVKAIKGPRYIPADIKDILSK
jgi:predicted HAD superfamily Cof-like phosphohydrolase